MVPEGADTGGMAPGKVGGIPGPLFSGGGMEPADEGGGGIEPADDGGGCMLLG